MLRVTVTVGLVLCTATSAKAAPETPPAWPPATTAPAVTVAPPASPPADTPATPPAQPPPAAVPPPATTPAPAVTPPADAAPPAGPTAAPPDTMPLSEPPGALAEQPGPVEESAVETVPETPADEPAFEATVARPSPPPAPAIPPPLYKGRGMIISGGIVGVLGFAAKIVTSVQAAAAVRRNTGRGAASLVGSGLVVGPVIGIGMGLVAGGMAQRGEWDAHHELFDTAAHKPRMRKSRRKLGWALFGGGMGLYGVTRLASLACPTDRCAVAVLETGYYSSLPLTVPGIALAGYGTGHDNYVKRFGALKKHNLTLSPTAGRTIGAAVSGRF